MKFNPEKCYICHPHTKKKIPLNFDDLLHNYILQPVDSSKYLGVTISNDLDPHINNITTIANKTLGFLHRNMKNCIRKFVPLFYTRHQFGIHTKNSKYHR